MKVAWHSDGHGNDTDANGMPIPGFMWAWGCVHLQHCVLSQFFPWWFLLQNFSEEVCASNTICWLNLALTGRVGKGSGADSFHGQLLFCTFHSCPRRAPMLGVAGSQHQDAAVGEERKPIPFSVSQARSYAVTPTSHVSMFWLSVLVHRSWGFGGF